MGGISDAFIGALEASNRGAVRRKAGKNKAIELGLAADQNRRLNRVDKRAADKRAKELDDEAYERFSDDYLTAYSSKNEQAMQKALTGINSTMKGRDHYQNAADEAGTGKLDSTVSGAPLDTSFVSDGNVYQGTSDGKEMLTPNRGKDEDPLGIPVGDVYDMLLSRSNSEMGKRIKGDARAVSLANQIPATAFNNGGSVANSTSIAMSEGDVYSQGGAGGGQPPAPQQLPAEQPPQGTVLSQYSKDMFGLNGAEQGGGLDDPNSMSGRAALRRSDGEKQDNIKGLIERFKRSGYSGGGVANDTVTGSPLEASLNAGERGADKRFINQAGAVAELADLDLATASIKAQEILANPDYLEYIRELEEKASGPKPFFGDGGASELQEVEQRIQILNQIVEAGQQASQQELGTPPQQQAPQQQAPQQQAPQQELGAPPQQKTGGAITSPQQLERVIKQSVSRRGGSKKAQQAQLVKNRKFVEVMLKMGVKPTMGNISEMINFGDVNAIDREKLNVKRNEIALGYKVARIKAAGKSAKAHTDLEKKELAAQELIYKNWDDTNKTIYPKDGDDYSKKRNEKARSAGGKFIEAVRAAGLKLNAKDLSILGNAYRAIGMASAYDNGSTSPPLNLSLTASTLAKEGMLDIPDWQDEDAVEEYTKRLSMFDEDVLGGFGPGVKREEAMAQVGLIIGALIEQNPRIKTRKQAMIHIVNTARAKRKQRQQRR